MKLKKSCCEIEKIKFIELSDNHEALSREEFCKKQDDKRITVEDTIQKYSRSCREDFREAIKIIMNRLKESITTDTEDREPAANSNPGQDDGQQK